MGNWVQFALGSAFFAALTAIFGKLGVEGLNSNLATWFRTMVVIAFLSLLLTFRGEWTLPSQGSLRGWVYLAVSGLCTGLSWICYYRALQLGPASKVAPVDKLSVALTIVLATIFLGEALSWKVALGGFLIVCGSIVLVL